MNKFYCQLIIGLIIFESFNCEINSIDNSFGSDKQFADIKQEAAFVAKDYLESLKSALKLVETEQENEESVRNKRSPQPYRIKADSFLDKGVFRLRNIVPFHSTCDRPVDFTTIPFNGQIYGICVSHSTRDAAAKVSVGPITSNGWEKNRISWAVKEPNNVISFVDEDKDTKQRNLYVLTADSDSADGTDVIVIDKNQQIINKEQHTVNSRYPTAIAVWKSRTDNTYHLAIANSYGSEQTQTYKSETFTYNWMQTYFDRYSEMTTYYVKDICPFNIHSNEFLAVANYKAGPNQIEVDSEIFKLDIDRKKWRSFQRIRTSGAVDWEFFTFGTDGNQEYFLAVANNFGLSGGRNKFDINSIIYKFSDDKFVPFQCIPTVGATQIKSFHGPKGEFVIAVANMHQAVHLYQYNGWHFVETSVQFTSGAMSPGVVSLHFDYLSFERSGVLFVSNPHHPSGHMFKLDFVYENPLGEWHNRSLDWCQNTERQIEQFGVNNVSPLMRDMFFIDQNQPIVIESDLNMTQFNTDSLQTPIFLSPDTDELSHRLIDELVKLDDEIRRTEEKLSQIVGILSNALRTDGDQVVTSPQTFNSVDFDCRPEFDCHFGRINTDVLNNDNINGLAEDTVPLNVDQKINHSMHFQNIMTDKNIILHGFINGLNTSHIVTKQGSHNIVSPKTVINDVIANEVIANRHINGMVINPSTVLLTIGDQIINNSMKFTENIVIPNLQVNGLINGLDINRFMAQIVTKDSDHIIGEKHFNRLEMNGLLMRPDSTVDGINLIKLWNEVLWTYGYQEVSVAMNFTNIKIDANLLVDGLINGISIPNDVMLINRNQLISGSKRFLTTVAINRTNILHSINGIGLVDRAKHELNLMVKSKVQKVFGRKYFNKVHLSGHNLVKGTVDGVKLSELKRTILYRNMSQHFDVLDIRGNAYFDGGIDLLTTINGLKLEELYNKALKLTERRIPAFPNFAMNLIKTKSIDCQSINGLNIGIDLMLKNSPQTIFGRKIFMNGIKADNDLIVKQINGLNMNFFNDTLLHDTQQYIRGEKLFVNDLWVKNLITNTINNISINDLVLLNADQTIPSEKVFKTVQIYNHLNIDSLESNVINDINLNELFENSLQYEKPQIITGRLNVESISIPVLTNFGTNSINGVNLRQLISDAVINGIPQTISGPKTFVAPINFQQMNFVNNFDNVTDFDLKFNWLLQDSAQTITSDLYFDQNISVLNNIIMKNPVINQINLNILDKNTVKLDEPALINGNTRFVANVVSEGHIELSGRIQGIDLDKEAVIVDKDNAIMGGIHFANGFDVDENLSANGTIDEVRVEELCRFGVRKNIHQIITGPTVVTGNLLINGPLNISNDLNGVRLEDFNRNVLKKDEPSKIEGIKHFRQLVIYGPILSDKLFCGFRVDMLYDNYMSLSRDQTVDSQIIFLNDVNFNQRLQIAGNLFTQNSSINGIDLQRLDASLLKTFGEQLITGEYTFEENVVFGLNLNVNQKVNNLDLIRDLMLKGRNHSITVPKIFAQDISVNNNLDIKEGMTIGGIDLSEMVKYSVMKQNSRHRIVGHKHFNSLEVDHLRVKLINGVDISDKSLLLCKGNQIITAKKIFTNGLTANQQINSNAINHINIKELSESLVLKGYNNSINSLKTFNSDLNVNNVRAFSRVDGVDLNELDYFIGLPVNLHDLRVKLGIEDQKIDVIQKALKQQSIQLEFYEWISTINSGPPLLSYYNPLTESQHLFISGQYLTNGCQEVDVFSQSDYNLKSMAKLYAIEPNLMTSFEWNGNHLVMVSNSKKMHDSTQCIRMNNFPNAVHYGKGPAVSQVFIFDAQQKNYKQLALIHSQSVTDLKVIYDQNRHPCLLIVIPVANGNLGNTLVLCMNSNQEFYFRESIPLSGIDQVSVIRSSSHNRTLIASINSWQPIPNAMSNIVICDWSSKLAHFDHSIQTIPFLRPATIHFVESPVHSSIFFFAAEKKSSLTHNPLVRVFRFNPIGAIPMTEVQQFRDLSVKQIDSVILDDYRVLVLMLSTDRIDLFSLKGSSGFIRVDTIDVQNAQNFIVSNSFKNNRISGHLITISLELCYSKNRRMCKQETHVLRSKFNVN